MCNAWRGTWKPRPRGSLVYKVTLRTETPAARANRVLTALQEGSMTNSAMTAGYADRNSRLQCRSRRTSQEAARAGDGSAEVAGSVCRDQKRLGSPERPLERHQVEGEACHWRYADCNPTIVLASRISPVPTIATAFRKGISITSRTSSRSSCWRPFVKPVPR